MRTEIFLDGVMERFLEEVLFDGPLRTENRKDLHGLMGAGAGRWMLGGRGWDLAAWQGRPTCWGGRRRVGACAQK